MISMQRAIVLGLALTVATAATAPACRETSPTLTPAAAASAEKDLVLLVRDASAEMLAAYKAGAVSAGISDPYFDAVDATVLPIARRAKTAIRAWHLAAEGPGKLAAGEQLKAILTELETEARAVFGRALPPGIAQKIGAIAGDVYDAIAKIRAQITAARTAAEDN